MDDQVTATMGAYIGDWQVSLRVRVVDFYHVLTLTHGAYDLVDHAFAQKFLEKQP